MPPSRSQVGRISPSWFYARKDADVRHSFNGEATIHRLPNQISPSAEARSAFRYRVAYAFFDATSAPPDAADGGQSSSSSSGSAVSSPRPRSPVNGLASDGGLAGSVFTPGRKAATVLITRPLFSLHNLRPGAIFRDVDILPSQTLHDLAISIVSAYVAPTRDHLPTAHSAQTC